VALVKLTALFGMNEVPLDQLSAGRFAEYVRTKFQVLAESGSAVSLELAAVAASGPAGQGNRTSASRTFESFSLLFDGPADPPLGQRTYRFTHERLGSFDLFIVPVSATSGSRQYEAVFNRRLVPPEESGKSG